MGEESEWVEDGSDATLLDKGAYFGETYAEVDGSYTVTVRRDGRDGVKVFHQEDVVCLYQAEQLAEIVMQRNTALDFISVLRDRLDGDLGLLADAAAFRSELGNSIAAIFGVESEGGDRDA